MASKLTLAAALKGAGLTDCLRLLQEAGAAAALASPSTRATVLCPTNAAVNSFLALMGLTWPELLARRGLVDRVAAYHTVPRARAAAAALSARRKSAPRGRAFATFAVSGDPHYLLRFTEGGGGNGTGAASTAAPTVRDAQGFTAKVVGADVDAGNSVVHAIDRVLMSGEYFPTLAQFFKFYGVANFTALEAALRAGGDGALEAAKWGPGTLFAPRDDAGAGQKAFAALKGADAKQARAAVLYQQLPELKVYPWDFPNGAAQATRLAGHTLMVTHRM